MSSPITQVVAEQDVHIGIWTNWSRGQVYGLTATLHSNSGGLLIAFLALYVSVVGTRSWQLLAFGIHQLSSTTKAENGLYHQKQLMLRSGDSDWSSLFDIFRIGKAWRGRGAQPVRRLLSVFIVALLHIVALTAAGIMSAWVVSSSRNEVLLASPNCGFLNSSIPTASENLKWDLSVAIPYGAYTASLSGDYAQQCYSSESTTDACPTYMQKSISSEIQQVPCPFQYYLCLNENTTLQLDTGHLRSLDDFGINMPPTKQFTWRMINTCSIVKTENHTIQLENFNNIPGQTVNVYLYDYDQPYFYPVALNENLENQTSNTAQYTIYTGGWHLEEHDDPTSPIPALSVNDSDVLLIYLSANSINYFQPVNDPYFSAHITTGKSANNTQVSGTNTFYYRDNPVNVMACKMQYQICNPSRSASSGCTFVGAALPVYEEAVSNADLWDSAEQIQSLTLFLYVLAQFNDVDLGNTIAFLGNDALLARQGALRGYQGPLPDDQWKNEVAYWHNATLANMQRLVVEQATGPSLSATNIYKQSVDEYNPVVCQAQMIRTTAYTSFSVLGIILIIVIGALIILLSFILEPSIRAYQRRKHHSTPSHGHYSSLNLDAKAQDSVSDSFSDRQREWLINSKFQLQRLAFEAADPQTTWTNITDQVPITKSRSPVLLPSLNIGRPKTASKSAYIQEVASSTSHEMELNLIHKEPRSGLARPNSRLLRLDTDGFSTDFGDFGTDQHSDDELRAHGLPGRVQGGQDDA